MKKRNLLCALVWVCLISGTALAEETETQTKSSLAAIEAQINGLKDQMERERREYEAKLKEMREQLDALSKKMKEEPEGDGEKALEQQIAKSNKEASSEDSKGGWSSVSSAIQSMNPEIAVSIDTVYYNDDTENGVGSFIGEVAGFGHLHADDDHGHDHNHYFDKGFNLREVELYLGASVDPYFTAYTTLAYHPGNFEVEEAVFQTTSIPWGFQVKGGKFLSDFSRINRQHPHEWDFVDRPLISELVFGYHGLLETGAQLSPGWHPLLSI
jgi:Skp family chaperone for outer membrane proteins